MKPIPLNELNFYVFELSKTQKLLFCHSNLKKQQMLQENTVLTK